VQIGSGGGALALHRVRSRLAREPLNTGPKKKWILAGVGRGIVLIDANEVMWQFFEQYELP